MSNPGDWFARRLEGRGYVLHLVRSDLALPTTSIDEFCDAVWRDAQETATQPVYDAGLQNEIVPRRQATWAQIVAGDGEHEGKYLVVTSDSNVVVGVVRIRREERNVLSMPTFCTGNARPDTASTSTTFFV